MAENSSPDDRRQDYQGRELFNRAVAQAAEIATQNVARIHRVRLVTQSFLAALVVSLGIGLLIAVGVYALVTGAERSNSLYNCHLLQNISVPLANFVSSDAKLRTEQAQLTPKTTSAFTQLLGKQEFLRDERKAARINAETTSYWLHTIAPQLASVEHVNCSAHIR